MMDMNSGYDGYRMSRRAALAYELGERPVSRWHKKDILDAVSDRSDLKVARSFLEKIPVKVLKDFLLEKSSWHHTGSYCQQTDFYSVREDLGSVTENRLLEAAEREKTREKESTKMYTGDFRFIVWEGTRNRRKATEILLSDVIIEEKGCFYTVRDREGRFIVRKKIGSNGTTAISNEAKQEKARRREEKALKKQAVIMNSSLEAQRFYMEIENNCEKSMSGNLYPRGRKPSTWDYDSGLENFFRPGEQSLRYDEEVPRYVLQTWSGTEWQPEIQAEV